MGDYGLYYRSPLVDLDVVIPAGAALGEATMSIDVLHPRSEHAQALAEAFVKRSSRRRTPGTT